MYMRVYALYACQGMCVTCVYILPDCAKSLHANEPFRREHAVHCAFICKCALPPLLPRLCQVVSALADFSRGDPQILMADVNSAAPSDDNQVAVSEKATE